ncbi:MAG: CaiB/BaiF CoA transferase family protein [Fidelibacterota bacterium]
MSEINRPLEGVRVVALEQYMSGPYCTMLLADAGAEVIKIERPRVGDPRRSIPPFAEKGGRKKAGGFMAYNRNKKSLCLNIRTEKGKKIYIDLVKSSDVVVENLRPGSTDRMGIGFENLIKVNSRLVYAAISGFGRMEGYQGPYSNRPAFDIVAEAMGGIMHLVGFEDKPPSWTIYGMADIYTGLCTAFGIMQALYMREKTGKGQFVDGAMMDAMLSLNERMVMLYSLTGQEPRRGRLTHLYPRGAFRCKNGYIALNVPDDLIWKRLCKVMDREDLIDDARSSNGTSRAAHASFLQPIIEEWLAGLTREEAEEIMNTGGIPVGSVYTAEDVFSSPQVESRRMLLNVEDAEVGCYKFSRGPVMLSSSPEPPRKPAPALGQHTFEILSRKLSLSAEEIRHLADSGIVELG